MWLFSLQLVLDCLSICVASPSCHNLAQKLQPIKVAGEWMMFKRRN